MFTDRRWIIINYDEVSSVDFSECIEPSSDHLRLSISTVAGIGTTATFVKWDGEDRGYDVGLALSATIAGVATYSGPYNHAEMLGILTGTSWFIGTAGTS